MIIARDKYLRQLIEARGNGMVKIVTGCVGLDRRSLRVHGQKVYLFLKYLSEF